MLQQNGNGIEKPRAIALKPVKSRLGSIAYRDFIFSEPIKQGSTLRKKKAPQATERAACGENTRPMP